MPSPALSQVLGGLAGGGSQLPLAMRAAPNLPNVCEEVIADFWKSNGDEAVQHPYGSLVAFLNQHPKCGGHRAMGYKKLFDLLADAEAAGLVCLRPGTVHNNLTGEPHPEVIPGPKHLQGSPGEPPGISERDTVSPGPVQPGSALNAPEPLPAASGGRGGFFRFLIRRAVPGP
mmetsp:Transcript_22556/g.62593  ORF Transcript_22556/g.62593 Transcript_22556/m.62593 type:complete len:173 (+) Transcript_22556:157-675(+)